MAIYSMLGSKIKEVTTFDPDSGAVGFVRESDGEFRKCHKSQLKADGGVAEIDKAIAAIEERALAEQREVISGEEGTDAVFPL
jgi:hypothetical protein